MNIKLTPLSEEILRRKVASGHDPSAVVEEALLLLDDQERQAALRDVLAIGEEEVSCGEVDRLPPELFDRLRDEARRPDQAARDADADVFP